MSTAVKVVKSCGIHPDYSGIVFERISHDVFVSSKPITGVSGGALLHIMPKLLLNDYQSERFSWLDLRGRIKVEVYLDDELLDLELRLMKPYPNNLYVVATHMESLTGFYVPLEVIGEHELRVEWIIDYGIEGRGLERISHIQRIVIDCALSANSSLAVYSVPESSYCIGEYSSASLGLFAHSDQYLGKERVSAFGTTSEYENGVRSIRETITIVDYLDPHNAAFCFPLLQQIVKSAKKSSLQKKVQI